MEVIKSTGLAEQFSREKLCASIKKAGAPHDLAQKICSLSEKELSPKITTTKIFRSALGHLVKEDLSLAASYGLRRAVDALGPAGFLFEQYVEIILQSHGYETGRNLIMRGYCVEHEIDVSAKKDGVHYLVEAKYRNEKGIKTHIDVVMYADARLSDIARYEEKTEKGINFHKLWIFTNTKFTEKSVQYAKCRDILLTGWNHPAGNSLEKMIISGKLYPITVLPSVSHYARGKFAEKNVILAQDLLPYSASDLSKEFYLSSKESARIAAEARRLIS